MIMNILCLADKIVFFFYKECFQKKNDAAFVAPGIERLINNLYYAHIWHGNGKLSEQAIEQGICQLLFIT